MSGNTDLQARAQRVQDKIINLVSIKDRVITMQSQRKESIQAITLAIENMRLYKQFFKEIETKIQIDNKDDNERVKGLLNEIEKNENELSNLLTQLNVSAASSSV